MYRFSLSRSFRTNEKQTLTSAALVLSTLLIFCFIVVLKPSLAPYFSKDTVIREPIGSKLVHAETDDRINLSCNFTKMSDYCEVRGDVRLNGNNATILSVVERESAPESFSLIVRPYSRKFDRSAMAMVRPWKVKVSQSNEKTVSCSVNHTVPGILFSVGSYARNHFHSFTDILVPLFAAAKPFNGEVRFIITDNHQYPRWVPKFQKVLKALSRYDEIYPDDVANDVVHCFPSVIVGIKHRSHKELSLEMAGTGCTVADFMVFLRKTYGLKKERAIKVHGAKDRRHPRLLIISRNKTRTFTNLGAITTLAESVGFEVLVDEPGEDLEKAAEMTNGCDVALGVHGAGLTNAMFLPEKAVLIQIIPFGFADWVGGNTFRKPAMGMKLRYIEYKIGVDESTLTEIYPRDDVVFRNPQFFKDQGWVAYRRVYFEQQNVSVNITRLKPILIRAIDLLRE